MAAALARRRQAVGGHGGDRDCDVWQRGRRVLHAQDLPAAAGAECDCGRYAHCQLCLFQVRKIENSWIFFFSRVCAKRYCGATLIVNYVCFR